MRLIISYTIILLCFGALSSNAQTLQVLEKAYAGQLAQNPREKLFIHTDKEVYIAGELLWLKIYNTDAVSNKPLDVSKVAYVEIIDKQQNAVVQTKIGLRNTTGSGSLNIPLTLNDGVYTLRAYTNWMKNFSPALFFEKKITIVNPLKTADGPAEKPQVKYDVQFFPEGGNMVRGLSAKVAFKITDNVGNGVDNVSGAVLDQRNDTVARFRPAKFGIGNFMFTPGSTTGYRAVVSIKGVVVNAPIPAIRDNGYTMQLTGPSNGQLQVELNAANVADNNLYLLVTNAATVKAAKNTQLVNGKASIAVSLDALADGLNYITVFNSQRQPVGERLYFKRPQSELKLTSQPDKQVYMQRSKVNINLASTTLVHAAPADLSVSVYQADSLQNIAGIDIKSYLWLKSELKGNIQSPAYYFTNINAQVDAALDNLLLTQGWREFSIDAAHAGFKFLPEFTGHVIKAIVTDSATKAPAANVLAYLAMPGKRTQTYAAKSDSAGILLFNTKDFYGTEELVIQTVPAKDSAFVVKVLSPYADSYNAAPNAQLNIDNAKAEVLKKHIVEMQVQNIFAGNMLRKYFDPGVDSSAFYYKPYKTYNLDDYTRFTTMEEVLREYVRQTLVYKKRGHYGINISGENGLLDDGRQLVMVDGVPVFNFDKIVAMDPLKVQKLDVIPAQYFYGPSEQMGVLNFRTYKGDMGGVDIDTRAFVIDYDGLQLERKFYSPVYDSADKQGSTIPDYRNVLYWNANAGTDATGKNQVSFYTGDQPGKYIIVVQGITPAGDCGSSYTTFEVK